MNRYEYKTLSLTFGFGFISKVTPDLATALNTQAAEGWRLKQVLLPAASLGESSEFIVVLERQVAG